MTLSSSPSQPNPLGTGPIEVIITQTSKDDCDADDITKLNDQLAQEQISSEHEPFLVHNITRNFNDTQQQLAISDLSATSANNGLIDPNNSDIKCLPMDYNCSVVNKVWI